MAKEQVLELEKWNGFLTYSTRLTFMTQSVQKQFSPYKNENLFSRHYLKKVIQRTSIWEVDEDEIEEAFEELEDIYESEKAFLPNREDDEEELRNDFITPILRRVLDFNKEQEKKSGGSQRIPDYALYDTAEKKKKALDSGEYYKHAIGLVEAKAWKKDLEKKTSTGDPSTDGSNPTKQIVDYLIENKPQWGMLTNGKKWRLVHREASNRLDTYYEVDIENLLTSERPREERLEEFKYFYIFFRKQAFQGDEGDKILDEILEESLKYAEDIGEDLEENIYQALEWLAKGFIENRSNDGIEDVPIQEIHDNSLIYLYRLLFALYADSRGILGDPGGKYDSYNFSALVDEVCEELDEGDGYGKSGLINNRLNAIFRMIDEGSQAQGIPKDELHIPAYNGGLFNQEKHEFLKEYNLHDKYLAKVIDLVARTEREEGGKAQVDYYDLSVRHLGGIYEGLLEYQLEKADEDMVEVKEDGDLQVKTVEEAEKDGDSFSDDDIIEEGQPYLVTDDGERKATGSYYTPDYIVKYIVENTVGPKVEEEIEGLETYEEKAEAILDMQILDPAMGSAHFLVEVIDYLATELVDHKQIEIEQAKREVARECVYGVDVNPLATELGKLSIWLKTISEDKPLSFLDHHIKTGNSLIGADIHEINRHPEEDEDSERQVTIGEEFGEENAGVVRANVQEMLKKFKEIQEKQADSPEDIKEQEELYQEFLDFPFRKRFDVLADVYTSHYFDNDYKVDDYNRLLQAFKLSEQKEEGDEEWNQVIKEDWVQKATDSLDKVYEENNISSQKGFFHWKLEFPEVFFDIEEGTEQEDAGFDAVVGNPPYVRMSNIPQDLRDYTKNKKDLFPMRFDLFNVFLDLADEFTSKSGYYSYIIPDTLLTNDNLQTQREKVIDQRKLRKIIRCGDDVFEDATVSTCILIIQKSKPGTTSEFVRSGTDFEKNGEISQEKYREMEKSRLLDLQTVKENEIIQNLDSTTDLEDIIELRSGIQVWQNKDDKEERPELLSDEKISKEHKPIITGNEIHKYALEDAQKWVLYEPEKLERAREKRIHTSEKIVFKYIGRNVCAALDSEGKYILKSVVAGLRREEKVEFDTLLGQVNSLFMQFSYNTFVGSSSYPRINLSNLKKLPIKEFHNESLSQKSKQLRNLQKQRYEEIRGFLGWVESEWNVKVDDLSLKTHIREYWEYDFDEFMRIAKKNKSQIDGNVNSREFRELMKDEWENSMLTLEPLMNKIDDLENEIDAIVFDLYDLTEEEVETVLDSLDTPEGEKASIMEKFEEVRS